MSDVGAAAAAAAATGVISIPFLSAMGIDPSAMVAGLVGCTIVQTVLPSEGRSVRAVVAVTLGSMLFSSLATPLVAPWAVLKIHAVVSEAVHHDPIRAATAAFLGGFAQPLLGLVPKLIDRFGGRFAAGKGGGDA